VLYHGRPVIGLGVGERGGPSDYAAEGLVAPCARPADLAALCRRLAEQGCDPCARERVWGGAPGDPVEAILEAEPGGADFGNSAHADRPVLIAGAPRSGTSLVAGIFARCGAWVGQTVPGGRSNPTGFFENLALREEVDQALLAKSRADPFGVDPLPRLESLATERGLRMWVFAVLAREGYRGDRPWVFKDPKLTLLWPLWARAFPRALWIVVRRPDAEVVRSCLATHFLSRRSADPEFWRRFARAYGHRLDRLVASGADIREVRPQEIVAGALAPVRELVEKAGLRWNAVAVSRFVRPSQWRAGAS
jgi:hypothetical protein